MPEIWIEMPEQAPGVRLPSPPKVEGYFTERLKWFRKFWNHVECVYRQHLCPFGYRLRPRENSADATPRAAGGKHI
jgi:hypothetical protein